MESAVKISVKPLLGNGVLLYRLKSKLALLYYVLRHKFEETWGECRQVPLNCTQIVCHSRILKGMCYCILYMILPCRA